MKLTALKSNLNQMPGSRLQRIENTAATPRIRGGKWMETRKRIAAEQNYRCVDCNRVWVPHRDQVDHDTPLEQGGSNDDSNLRLRCDACHRLKTDAEATLRAGRVL